MYNSTLSLDQTPIQVILTDSLIWRFYYFDFSTMSVWRGTTNIRDGYSTEGGESVNLPLTENHKDYVAELKIGRALPWDMYSLAI